MFETQELEKIDGWLQEGKTPEEIAEILEIKPSTFRYQLRESGRGIQTFRRLTRLAAADEPRELAAA